MDTPQQSAFPHVATSGSFNASAKMNYGLSATVGVTDNSHSKDQPQVTFQISIPKSESDSWHRVIGVVLEMGPSTALKQLKASHAVANAACQAGVYVPPARRAGNAQCVEKVEAEPSFPPVFVSREVRSRKRYEHHLRKGRRTAASRQAYRDWAVANCTPNTDWLSDDNENRYADYLAEQAPKPKKQPDTADIALFKQKLSRDDFLAFHKRNGRYTYLERQAFHAWARKTLKAGVNYQDTDVQELYSEHIALTAPSHVNEAFDLELPAPCLVPEKNLALIDQDVDANLPYEESVCSSDDAGSPDAQSCLDSAVEYAEPLTQDSLYRSAWKFPEHHTAPTLPSAFDVPDTSPTIMRKARAMNRSDAALICEDDHNAVPGPPLAPSPDTLDLPPAAFILH